MRSSEQFLMFLVLLLLLKSELIECGEASKQILKDGSFECSALSSVWTPFVSRFYSTERNPHSGERSAELSVSGRNSIGGGFQFISLNDSHPNLSSSLCETFLFKAWAYTEWQFDIELQVTLRLNFREKRKMRDISLPFKKSSHGWKESCKVILLPKGNVVSSAVVYLIASKKGENCGTVWVDDLKLFHHTFEAKGTQETGTFSSLSLFSTLLIQYKDNFYRNFKASDLFGVESEGCELERIEPSDINEDKELYSIETVKSEACGRESEDSLSIVTHLSYLQFKSLKRMFKHWKG